MKKLSLLLFLTLVSVFSIQAKDLEKGYRGFVDLNMEFGSYKAYRYIDNTNLTNLEEYRASYMLYGVSTSHGYQFNPHFFLGAGVWLQAAAGDIRRHRIELPVFLQGRTDWTFGKVPLYFDLRVGISRGARELKAVEDKLLISPSIGYRLDWGRKVSANFGIGLSLHGGKQSNNFTFVPLTSIRLGIEF